MLPGPTTVTIETHLDLRPHMESPDWTEINAGIQQHLQKAYNNNKSAFKAQHWVIDLMTGTYNVEKIKRERPENITANQTSTTQEYSSLIKTFFVAYTINGEFLQDEDWCIYEEMRMLEAMGIYTDDEINRLAREGSSEGTLPVWVGYCWHGPQPAQVCPLMFESGDASRSGRCGDEEEGADH
nr:hypothetical protein [Tanacetum cinerariifolium]